MGRAKKFECPTEHAFNHIIKMCDWRENVDCTRKEIMTTEITSESSEATTVMNATMSLETTTVSFENTTNFINSTLIIPLNTTIIVANSSTF